MTTEEKTPGRITLPKLELHAGVEFLVDDHNRPTVRVHVTVNGETQEQSFLVPHEPTPEQMRTALAWGLQASFPLGLARMESCALGQRWELSPNGGL